MSDINYVLSFKLPSNKINLHWDRDQFSIKIFDFDNFESSERPIFMFDKKPSSDLWFLTLSRFLTNHQNLKKFQILLKLQSLINIKALEIWALKWLFSSKMKIISFKLYSEFTKNRSRTWFLILHPSRIPFWVKKFNFDSKIPKITHFSGY